MSSDLTIIYLTVNEMPERWHTFQFGRLLAAVEERSMVKPGVVVSREPIEIPEGWLLLSDDGPKGYWNIYMQMLRAAKLATTPYVAVAEDDVLYSREHFREFRPPRGSVAFNRSRWSLFAWEEEPIFCLRQRLSNCSMIADREFLVECIAERARKWPNGAPQHLVGEVGRPKVDRRLHVTVRPAAIEWWSTVPIIHLNHPSGTDCGSYGISPSGRRLVKKHGQLKAVEVPYWGRAADIARIYNEP